MKFKLNVEEASKVLLPTAFMLIIITLIEFFIPQNMITSGILSRPSKVIEELVVGYRHLWFHSLITLNEATLGLLIAVAFSIVLGVVLDLFPVVKKMIYPFLLVTQTVPIISLAPLFVLWFGYGISAKIFIVSLICFFPITVSLISGFEKVDPKKIKLLKTMGASDLEIFRIVKIPSALPDFFTGLKISATYSIMGAVIGEWLGGTGGLGIYMTSVVKSYRIDRLFAAIFIISVLSLAIYFLIIVIEKLVIPWRISDK